MNSERPKDSESQNTGVPNSSPDQTIAPTPGIGGALSPGVAARMAPDVRGGVTAPPLTPPPQSNITGEFAALVGPTLIVGSVLAGRYEILQMLGQGGMGAVYKARDRQVDRLVAIKIIRPEMAANPAILQRFIQELVLARQITHRNVIRIYDIGEAEGVKFITMEYVEGRDLRSILEERGKLPPEEAVTIVEQIAAALSAAHHEGVIHRDLKPGNIMQDSSGRIVVMDFGLARTVGGDGMTQTGMMLGTMEYMSPEQAKAEELDARSDLYTLGLIFFELLSGQMPFKADSALASLVMRTQQRATPLVSVDPNIPPALSNIVARCLERVRDQRYRTADELAEDLRAWRGGAVVKSVLVHPTFPEVTKTPVWRYITAAVVAIAVLVGVSVFVKMRYFPSPVAVGPTVSLAILPFRNASGDPKLDWMATSLAEVLNTDVGQSKQLRVVAPDRLHQILKDLHLSPGAPIDDSTLKRIADYVSADLVVFGQYARFGDQLRIDATLLDIKHDRSTPLKAEAPTEKQLLDAVNTLAKAVQGGLTLPPEAKKELADSAFTPTGKSVDALRFYSEGLELKRQGNQLEALKRFQSAVTEDSNFALAFAAMADTYAKLGYSKEAEQNAAKAAELSDALPPAQRYLIAANNARLQNNYEKAADAYENVLKLTPNDPRVNFDVASLYEGKGDFANAKQHYNKVLEYDPKFVEALVGLGRVEIKSKNPQGSLDYLNRALSFAIELDNQQGKATILQALGIAYRSMNKPTDALRNFQESLEIKKKIGDKRGAAASLNEIAVCSQMLGDPEKARANYLESLKIQREIGDKNGTGITLTSLAFVDTDRGKYDDALKSAKEALQIEQELGNENMQGYVLNNIGNIYLGKGQYDDALTYYQQALQLREKSKVASDMADTLHNLAETSAHLGQNDQALGYFLRALDLARSGGDKKLAAQINFSMGTVFQMQGRYGASLTAKEDALKTFNELNEKTAWMAEVLGGYGNALALVGRDKDADDNLAKGLQMARDVKDDPMVALIVGYQGDRLFYRGDFKGARGLYEQAQQLASKTTDRERILVARFNLAKLAVKDGRAREAVGALRKIAQDAEAQRLKYVSAEANVYLGEALYATKDYRNARDELESALRKADNMGLLPLKAIGSQLLGATLRASGKDGDAERYQQQATQLLQQIQQEAQTQALSSRTDLKVISDQSALAKK